MSDWITNFLDYTAAIPSPASFRLWSAITAISGVLERKIWIQTAQSFLYPNLFTLLVGPPATGKTQAINQVQRLWYDSGKVHVSPDDMTKASFLDAMRDAARIVQLSEEVQASTDKLILDYHSLSVCVGEFGVLLSQHDLNFLSVFNSMYDCPPVYREKRRMKEEENDISNPTLVMLAGTQPGFLGSLLPEEAWNMGFTSRLIMVYSGDILTVELFNKATPSQTKYSPLLGDLQEIAGLVGQIKWTPETQDAIRVWHQEGCPPVPQHSKLEHYRGRRILHVLKLCAISTISRSKDLLVTLEDFERAKMWLMETEIAMPDIFRQMARRSDAQVIQELHWVCWAEWTKTRRALHESFLIHFLSTQVPTEKIAKVMEMAEKGRFFSRQAGTQLFIPLPKNKHGIE